MARIAGRGTGPWLRLAAAAGGARALLGQSDEELLGAGLAPAGLRRLRETPPWPELDAIDRRCRLSGVRWTTVAGRAYPALLRAIPDPPLILYFRGDPGLAGGPAVAVVGARRTTPYGRCTATALGRELAAAGVAVVSGLARGIDRAAHEGALSAGTTVAVLAGGLDRPYPASHRDLFERVIAAGVALSEHAPGVRARPYSFPVRNRIITGLARATVVVEAGRPSGSLVSARLALEQGRELLAVPGNVDSPASRGTNDLIRQGCPPLLEPDDALRAIGLDPGAPRPGPTSGEGPEVKNDSVTGGDVEAILRALDHGPCHVDEVVETARLDGTRVMELLTALELEGRVERGVGATFVRVGSRFGASAD